jgi:hypothetical protein
MKYISATTTLILPPPAPYLTGAWKIIFYGCYKMSSSAMSDETTRVFCIFFYLELALLSAKAHAATRAAGQLYYKQK